MGWNGSDRRGNTAPVQPKVTAKKPSPVRGIVAGLVVVAVACSAYFVFFSSSEKPQTEKADKERGRIKEVTPATNKVATAEKPKKDVIVWQGKEYPRYNKFGGEAYITGYGVRYHSTNVITSYACRASIPWEAKPFKRYTDQTIAILLNTEPGTGFVGDIKYDKRFTEQFLKSLNEPIEILPDDSDDVKDLKQAVIETRADLKKRHDEGEDVAEIIQKTRDELRELGAYKQELQKQLGELSRRKDMTEKDLDDYVTAANMMLESRGCSKLTMPEFIRRGVRMREEHFKKVGVDPKEFAPKKGTDK